MNGSFIEAQVADAPRTAPIKNIFTLTLQIDSHPAFSLCLRTTKELKPYFILNV
jgi:hypothetical protein